MCADNADDVPLAPIARGRAPRAAPSSGGRDLAARRSGGAFLAQRDCELAPVVMLETLRGSQATADGPAAEIGNQGGVASTYALHG